MQPPPVTAPADQAPRPGSLDLSQDPANRRRDARFERAGRVVFASLVVAALAGLLGRGPLSWATTADAEGVLRLDHDRIARYRAPTSLRLRVAPAAVHDGRVRVWIDAAFLSALDLGGPQPPPLSVELGMDRHTYTFAAPALAGPGILIFEYEPHASLRDLLGRIGLEGGPTLQFRQFVLP